MEYLDNPEKHFLTEIEREELDRQLGSLGLYDAQLDMYDNSPHELDNIWSVD